MFDIKIEFEMCFKDMFCELFFNFISYSYSKEFYLVFQIWSIERGKFSWFFNMLKVIKKNIFLMMYNIILIFKEMCGVFFFIKDY